MKILIDMDGVLADFVPGFKRAWMEAGLPPCFDDCNWEQWDLTHYVPVQHRDMVDVLMQKQGFFRTLQPVPGAIDAVLTMLLRGHELWVCSTPVFESAYCENEKKAWLQEHFGDTFAKRVVFTHDKTLVRGEILIDDKPMITGAYKPEWEHVVYSQPYNRDVKDRRRLTWTNWSQVPELRTRVQEASSGG